MKITFHYQKEAKERKLITEYDIRQILKQDPNMREINILKDTILNLLTEYFININKE